MAVPVDGGGSRAGLGLALALLSMQHLSVEVTELHLIIVQQAQTPWGYNQKKGAVMRGKTWSPHR